jgi:hypothetical protein
MVKRRIRPPSGVPSAAFVLAAAFVGVVPFVEAAKPLPEVSLYLTFGVPNGIQSDGQIAPVLNITADYADGKENVRAFLFPSGNLSFNTHANTAAEATREVCFGPGVPISLTEDPFPSGCWPMQNQVMGGPLFYSPDWSVNIQTLGLGGSVLRLTRFNWKIGTDTYHLGYGTDMDGNDELDSPEVRVTCTAANTQGKCTTWTVAPVGNGTAALFVARQVPGKGGKMTTGPNEYVGHYLMPFVQTLTVQ